MCLLKERDESMVTPRVLTVEANTRSDAVLNRIPETTPSFLSLAAVPSRIPSVFSALSCSPLTAYHLVSASKQFNSPDIAT
mgnify:FL=1